MYRACKIGRASFAVEIRTFFFLRGAGANHAGGEGGGPIEDHGSEVCCHVCTYVQVICPIKYFAAANIERSNKFSLIGGCVTGHSANCKLQNVICTSYTHTRTAKRQLCEAAGRGRVT